MPAGQSKNRDSTPHPTPLAHTPLLSLRSRSSTVNSCTFFLVSPYFTQSFLQSFNEGLGDGLESQQSVISYVWRPLLSYHAQLLMSSLFEILLALTLLVLN